MTSDYSSSPHQSRKLGPSYVPNEHDTIRAAPSASWSELPNGAESFDTTSSNKQYPPLLQWSCLRNLVGEFDPLLLCHLDLSSQQLTSCSQLSHLLSQCQLLRRLILKDNQLTNLDFCRFMLELRELDVSNNCITCMPVFDYNRPHVKSISCGTRRQEVNQRKDGTADEDTSEEDDSRDDRGTCGGAFCVRQQWTADEEEQLVQDVMENRASSESDMHRSPLSARRTKHHKKLKIEKITAQGNPITTIEDISGLRELPGLEYLSFQTLSQTNSCPVCHDPNYPDAVLVKFKGLKALDGYRLTLPNVWRSNLKLIYSKTKIKPPSLSPLYSPAELNVDFFDHTPAFVAHSGSSVANSTQGTTGGAYAPSSLANSHIRCGEASGQSTMVKNVDLQSLIDSFTEFRGTLKIIVEEQNETDRLIRNVTEKTERLRRATDSTTSNLDA
eukprot:GHVQ01022928.1.p1 GENE.GHVQ01022928.1~~GHVQ01022928.1.p1  ORF type:complete len:494 (+),score=49.96 GHVQ01022928.1:154-1482(+)